MKMPQSDRQALKQGDAFVVFGAFYGDRRSGHGAGSPIEFRSALTLDFDHDSEALYAALVDGAPLLPCAYICHTTRSHTPEVPHLRLIVPLSRDVDSSLAYRGLVELVARCLPRASMDPGSVQSARPMYMPVQNDGAEYLSDIRLGHGFLDPSAVPPADSGFLAHGNYQLASNEAMFDRLMMKEPDARWTAARVKTELLTELDPNGDEWDRKRWLTLGMALHHQGEGDEAWLEMWDNWSQLDERTDRNGEPMYQPGLCEKEWASFGRAHHVVTIGSIVHWARMARGDAPGDGHRHAEYPKAACAPSYYCLRSAEELANAPPLKWLVRGVISREGLFSMFGAPGSGKSFLMLALAAAVAGAASDWFGRRVECCPVTYCVLEGEAGMSKRVRAWALHNESKLPESLRFMTQPFDLLDPAAVVALATAVREVNGAGGMVVLDTLNRATPGADENSSVDMGKIIAAAKRLQGLLGGVVLLVHHSGKDAAKGLRGHSSLHAALDGAIEVTGGGDQREWRVAKSKDDETGTVYGFRLVTVTLGDDEYGDPITSCVAVPDESAEAIKRVRMPQGKNQKAALEAVTAALRDSFDVGEGVAPQNRASIRLNRAFELVANQMPDGQPKHKMQRAKEAIYALVNRGFLAANDEWLWSAA